MQKKLVKTGNCDAIIVDKTIREITGIQPRELVDIKCSKGKIIITRVTPEGTVRSRRIRNTDF